MPLTDDPQHHLAGHNDDDTQDAADRTFGSAPAAAAPGLAFDWLTAGYRSPAAITEWTAIGITTPQRAQQWIEAGFTPESAALWVEVQDMSPSEAATCANGGLSPVDVERVRRADPGWRRPEPQADAVEPGWGIQA